MTESNLSTKFRAQRAAGVERKEAALVALIGDYQDQIEQLKDALEKSVALQSHYADLLNMHDGGQRLQFASADEWCARLAKLAKPEGVESNRKAQP